MAAELQQLSRELLEVFEQSSLLIANNVMAGIRARDPDRARELDRLFDQGARLSVSFVAGAVPQIDVACRDDAGTTIVIATLPLEHRTKQ